MVSGTLGNRRIVVRPEVTMLAIKDVHGKYHYFKELAIGFMTYFPRVRQDAATRTLLCVQCIQQVMIGSLVAEGAFEQADDAGFGEGVPEVIYKADTIAVNRSLDSALAHSLLVESTRDDNPFVPEQRKVPEDNEC